MEEFYRKMAEILEEDEVSKDGVLEEFPAWDSLTVLSVIAMIDSDYGVSLVATDLAGIKTIGDLEKLMLAKKGG